MAQFPIKQAEVMALAESVTAGLADSGDVYPSPPVSAEDLRSVLSECSDAMGDVQAAKAAYEAAVTAKNSKLSQLKSELKKDLRYAENTVDFDDDKLKRLGWSAVSERKSLVVPGQVKSLRAVEQGNDWIHLKWNSPEDGGGVVFYKIYRRNRQTGSFQQAGTSLKVQLKLTSQPRHTDIEYRLTAVNKAGEGEPSNTIFAVL